MLFNELMVHEKILDQAVLIEGSVEHYSYKSKEHWRDKFQQYAKRQAIDYDAKTGEITAWHTTIKPSYRFFKHYVVKGGIFDGVLGWNIVFGCSALLNGAMMKSKNFALK